MPGFLNHAAERLRAAFARPAQAAQAPLRLSGTTEGYVAVLQRCADGLDGEARRALYQRARTTLVMQIKDRNADFTSGEIEREWNLLEDALHEVEAGARRRECGAQPSPSAPAAVADAQEAIQEAIQEASPVPADEATASLLHPRLRAIIEVGRYHGVELDPADFRLAEGVVAPSAAALSQWAQGAGMWSRALRIGWRHLLKLTDAGPVVLLLTDGAAALLTGVAADKTAVQLRDAASPPGSPSVAVDELRLSQVWDGEAVLLRGARGSAPADALFNLGWLVDVVARERKPLRDIAIASLTLSFLSIFPPLLVMSMVNRVLQFRSMSTLILLSAIMAVMVFYEAMLGYARRLIISIIGARLDTRLNLHLFSRLLRLPLDYFERHPAGETMYLIGQIYRVREFLTGGLLATLLDFVTLCVLLPFLFYLNATLAWIVLACALAIALIILAFLKPLRQHYMRVASAETWKSAALGETIVGMKTVKALALEPQRLALWDERVAEAGKCRLAFGRLANWPQTLATPIERMMVMGTLMLGAGMAMSDPSGYLVGSLFAFMMLSQRVAQPLTGMARLVEDYEEVAAAIGEVGSVLNWPLEIRGRRRGPAAEACRRHQLPERHLHLSRDEKPGAGADEF